LIQSSVKAGITRAKTNGVKLGKKKLDDAKVTASVRKMRAAGLGLAKIGRALGIGTSTVQRLLSE
jgi:DNA invertase Pin-like site-specific DNA recombinase